MWPQRFQGPKCPFDNGDRPQSEGDSLAMQFLHSEPRCGDLGSRLGRRDALQTTLEMAAISGHSHQDNCLITVDFDGSASVYHGLIKHSYNTTGSVANLVGGQ